MKLADALHRKTFKKSDIINEEVITVYSDGQRPTEGLHREQFQIDYVRDDRDPSHQCGRESQFTLQINQSRIGFARLG